MGLFPSIGNISSAKAAEKQHQGVGDGINSFFGWLDGSNAAKNQYDYNLSLQKDMQLYNSAEAEKDRQWQTEMANSQYQRGVADLKAAGLNPWLAVQGSAAATPGGATASSSAANVQQKQSGSQVVSQLASSAVSAAIIAKIIAKALA